jgi:hypothetical protein
VWASRRILFSKGNTRIKEANMKGKEAMHSGVTWVAPDITLRAPETV